MMFVNECYQHNSVEKVAAAIRRRRDESGINRNGKSAVDSFQQKSNPHPTFSLKAIPGRLLT